MSNPWSPEKIKLPPISSITNFDDALTPPPQTAPVHAPHHAHHQSQHYPHQPQHSCNAFPFAASTSQRTSPMSSPQWPPAYHSQPRISSPILTPPHNMNQLNNFSLPQLVPVEPRFPLQYYQQPQQPQQQQQHHQQYPPMYYQQPELIYQQPQQQLQQQQPQQQRQFADQRSLSSSSTGAKPTIRRRTRTGCLTCRKRRVKCDERKPFCYNCERSRNVCSGYENLASTKFRKQRTKSEEGSTDASNTTSPEMVNAVETKRARNSTSSQTPPEQHEQPSDNDNEQKHEHLPPKVGFLVN